MAKFNLKTAKAEAAKENQHIESGYHRGVITQVAEVGLQRGFNADDPAKDSIGITFQLSDGLELAKVMPLSLNIYSNLTKLLSATDSVEEIEELLGQQLDLEIEGGQYPKIIGYYHIEDRLSGQVNIEYKDGGLFYSVEEPNPDSLKQLHRTLRQAISTRVRSKE